MTAAQAQRVCNAQGGYIERRAPIVVLESDNGEGGPSNIVDGYDQNGEFVASIAWRPHHADLYPPDGLLLC